MSLSRGPSRAVAIAEAGWVVAHHALPGWLLTALSTTLRVPLLVGSASALLGAAAVLAATVHLAVRLEPELAVPVLALALALGPLARAAIGATPPLVASVAAVAPLLRALELGGVRASGALAAIAPVLLGSFVVSGAAALSLATAGDARAAVVVAAAGAGLGAAGVLAALRGGRPLLSGLPARLAGVLAAGAAAWAALGVLRAALVRVDAIGAIAAAPAPLVLAIAAAPALWVAGELLARDARPLVQLVRELVSCGAPAAAPAGLLAAGILTIGIAPAPIAAALATLTGGDLALAAVAIAWFVVVAASAVVLLEPGSERAAVRVVAFAMLLTPPFLVATGAVAVAWLPVAGAAVAAAGVTLPLGRPR
ncbi:hypothetical protein [Agrococcus sp. TSP3-2-1]|uniref:hypothetical protein n=1 Tax=Agrococcus sp. TSP3-2-1 TaxID=2804583 RepID=UPI003CF6EA9F